MAAESRRACRAPRSVVGVELGARALSTLAWVFGGILSTTTFVALYPTIAGNEAVQGFVDRLPRAMLMMFGIDGATFTSGVGFLQAELYTMLAPALVIAFAVGAGSRATAAEEQDGTAEIVLAQPLSRSSFVFQKFVALSVVATAIVLGFALPIVVGNGVTELEVPLRGIFGANLGLLLLGLTHGALAMVVGAWSGSAALAAGVAAGYALFGFLVEGLSALVEALVLPAKLTPFHWYQSGSPMLTGPTGGHALLAVATAVLVALAAFVFRKRDLGTGTPGLGKLVRTLRAKTGRVVQARRPTTRTPKHAALLTSPFGRTIWDRRLSMVFWVLGLCIVAGATVAFWPSIEQSAGEFEQLMDLIPREVFAAFGIDDPALLLTPAGFLSARLYAGVALIVIVAFAVALGSSVIAGEERRGTLEIELSMPISRCALVLSKLGALATLVIVLTAALAVTIGIGNAALGLELQVMHILAANAALAAVGIFFGALSLAIGAGTGRLAFARGVPMAILVAGFLTNLLSAVVDELSFVRWASPVYWYLGDAPVLSRGLSVGVIPLALGTLALALAAIWSFERRDIGG